jgi:hypothetical protein
MPELCDHDRYLQSDWQAREDASDPDAPDWFEDDFCIDCGKPFHDCRCEDDPCIRCGHLECCCDEIGEGIR